MHSNHQCYAIAHTQVIQSYVNQNLLCRRERSFIFVSNYNAICGPNRYQMHDSIKGIPFPFSHNCYLRQLVLFCQYFPLQFYVYLALKCYSLFCYITVITARNVLQLLLLILSHIFKECNPFKVDINLLNALLYPWVSPALTH